MHEWPLRGVCTGEAGVDAGRWLFVEMRVCGSYHLRADIFLVTLDESKWVQSKCGNLRRDEKAWNSH